MIRGLPERIKILRVKNGLSQKELAEKMNRKPRTICLWENGKQGISLENFLGLAKGLGVSTEVLNPENEIKITV